MTTEEKIKKWLSDELTENERMEFENSEEFAGIKRLLNSVQNFKAGNYDTIAEYKKLSEKLGSPDKTITFYEKVSPLLKIAAILLVGVVISYLTFKRSDLDPDKNKWIVENSNLYLPDSSFIYLNTDSEIRYSEKGWEDSRKVELTGEAYFEVKEGSQFRVNTQQGEVMVLGTEFTVKDREGFFEVNCFSGSVKVSAGKKSIILRPETSFRILNGREEIISFPVSTGPDWLNGESRFRSVPLKLVIDELERQYNIPVETRNVQADQLFTGSFSHENIEIALKSITIPLNLHYEIDENKIVINIEGK